MAPVCRRTACKRGKMEKIKSIADEFAFRGTLKKAEPYGDGHINDTYALVYENHGEQKRYILQTKVIKKLAKNMT